MKYVIVSVFALTAASAFAANCEVNEAQFFGTVLTAESVAAGCKLGVELASASNHVFCPLGVSKGEKVSFNVRGACPAVGSSVDGILQSTKTPGEYRLDN